MRIPPHIYIQLTRCQCRSPVTGSGSPNISVPETLVSEMFCQAKNIPNGKLCDFTFGHNGSFLGCLNCPVFCKTRVAPATVAETDMGNVLFSFFTVFTIHMKIAAIDVGYKNLAVVVVEVDDDWKWKNIHLCRRLSV